MKKSLLALLCVFALLEAKAQNSSWVYDFGTVAAAPYTSTNYSSTYLPAPLTGAGNSGVRASSTAEGPVELISSNFAGGSGAELKMTSGTTTPGAKFGLAPFTATPVANFQCKINISSGTNGRFLLYFGNGSNFTSSSGLSLPQTFAALRLSPTSTAVSLDWLSSATSPNYTTVGLSQTTLNKNQAYTLKFFMNNSNSTTSYVTGSGTNTTTHNLLAGTFDIWIDNVKVLTNADPGAGLLPQGTTINGMNLLNVGAGSSAPVIYIDDITYSNFLTASPPPPPPTITGTILNVNYENGTTNSGFTGIDVTHATAPDAAFIVPGYNSTYGIGHTVKMGNPAYESDGGQRSESSTVDAYQFFPGEERRYEVSIKMKDWPAWTSTDPLYGVVLFQLKMSDGVGEPLRVIAQRNGIESKRDVRNANGDAITTSAPLVDNFRNYVNDWIHLRIDVKWTTNATGYIKIYTKLPGEQDYSLKDQSENIVTFVSQSAGNIGYLKWGVYTRAGNPGESLEGNTTLTFTAHHDNIKVFELNNTSTPIALWNNMITDNNPAYLPAPYSPANDVLASNVLSNSTSPSSDFSRNSLTPAGGATLNGRYLLGGWATGSAVAPSPFDAAQYYEFKIAPKPCHQLNFKNITFNWRTAGVTNPNTYVLRSSLDNFTNNISAPVTVSDDATNTSNFGNSSIYDLANISTNSEITFRMYWYGATTSGGLVGIDNFTFNGNVLAVESNLQIETKNNIIKNTDNAVSTYTVQSNEFDATATGNCDNITYSYVLSGATIASGTGSLANKVFNKGVTTVIWTATDGCSSNTTSFNITVNDIEKPSFTLPDAITVSNDENQCGAAVLLPQPIVTDNCAVATITNNAPELFPLGTTTVIWTAVDVNGNTATTSQTVTVIDSATPTLNAIASVSLCYDTSNNYTIPLATATDNCTINTVTYEITGATTRNGNGLDASGNFNVGQSSIKWTVTDNAGNSNTATTTVTINNIFSSNISDVYAVNPGGNANTIYLGYGPSSLALTATPSNGIAPFTYLWSNGATANTISVSPSTIGIHDYNVVITDALGCSTSTSKQIKVVDVLCASKKVTVCHNNKSLCISTNAVSAHLAHGCYLGDCQNTFAKNNMISKQIDDFEAIVSPNPTRTEFQITITGGDETQAILINLFDLSGRKINTVKSNYTSSMILGSNLSPGAYLAEIHNGTNTQTIKLIKQ
ncbi:heparin lyase I family protein [Flavobacterium phragmitis]|uniref:Por secretion system C-terminal sorting domain-containing protein n=1 Tax=Flavobacterium phragmitis TaxID=739143 RepID=A0A1I1NBN6_9FLAO|nr:heparin lyase I family protein [Flavobacterium phragmitis]SFC95134.1 Por secretion system C-terminal sorting domain-containing protein [Flavobacterium phragmitis]